MTTVQLTQVSDHGDGVSDVTLVHVPQLLRCDSAKFGITAVHW